MDFPGYRRILVVILDSTTHFSGVDFQNNNTDEYERLFTDASACHLNLNFK